LNHSPTARTRSAAALLAALAMAFAPALARAGDVDGPFLIWMNFAQDDSIDHVMHEYTHTPTNADMCWKSSGRLLKSDFPPAITPALVKRAVFKRDKAAQARLKALLRKGDDDRPEGFDGVIVVPKGDKPMLMSFGTDGKVRSHSALDKAGKLDWTETFCDVQPPILRKP